MSAADQDPHDAAVDDNEQPFLDHLIELRMRILRSFAFVFVLFIPIYAFSDQIFAFVAAPLIEELPEGGQMIATQVTTPFLTPFKLAIYMAVFIGIPFLLHQLWAFVSPGLYRGEKRFAVPLLLSSVILFYCGMAFCYYLVFPLVFGFFAQISPADVTMMTDINSYLDFVLKMFLAFGMAFEIPVATCLLAWSGLASAAAMAAKRPFVIIGCFVVGMLMTPPDVISQLLLAVPTWLLFEFGVILARLVENKGKEKSGLSEEGKDSEDEHAAS